MAFKGGSLHCFCFLCQVVGGDVSVAGYARLAGGLCGCLVAGTLYWFSWFWAGALLARLTHESRLQWEMCLDPASAIRSLELRHAPLL